MIRVFEHKAGSTRSVERVDPASLQPGSGTLVWVDLDRPTPEESRILSEVFAFHELSVEDALNEIHHPKIESYGEYLYLVLHGIDFQARQHRFKTQDFDFFLSDRYLVTVHHGGSRSIGRIADICTRNGQFLGEGTAALLHRIVDTMVDNYRPEIDKLQDRLDHLEGEIFTRPDPHMARRILDLKRDVASLRQVVLPQRDAVGRLARREYAIINEPLAYRFRDVHDHLVRIADEAMFFQDRISSILEAHLSTVSNQLSRVTKVLTIIATLFMPLTVLTSLWGMNIPLPHFPGGEAVQFWWIAGFMLLLSAGMLIMFRIRNWI